MEPNQDIHDTGLKSDGARPPTLLARFMPTAFRFITRMGLQGQLVGVFMVLLAGVLIATCWLWASQIGPRITTNIGQQATQMAYALSLAAAPSMAHNDIATLNVIGHQLLYRSSVHFVAFYDANGNSITICSTDPSFSASFPAIASTQVESLSRVQRADSPSGELLAASAPVFDLPKITSGSSQEFSSPRIVGYVAVGMSTELEQTQLKRTAELALGIGCIMVLLCFPLSYYLVHHVFAPIRQLVFAAHRITAGDLETQVDDHGPDEIGELARAFNEMAQTVKWQRLDLQRANEDLEKKITDRTELLEKTNSRLSREIAEKEDFLRAVSHDLNAPLRNISGMASMLLMKHRQEFTQDVIHRLERIQKNVEVESDLIAELLELSRIKTRRQKMEPVEIGALIRELGEIFDSDLRSRQILLTVDSNLPVLSGERARFRQVFQNLIDNAIKYMGEGTTREIHVGCTPRPTDVEFYVRDTGMGIDPEDIGKVFNVFRRGKNTMSANIAGKGVGLASVKSIIEIYGGSIAVESRLGQGSTFRFTIGGQYVTGSQPAGQTGAGSSV